MTSGREGITVVIPTIPTRREFLANALDSVYKQSLGAYDVIVETDWNHYGAAVTRDRGLRRATTKWVAFLDDDDYFLPEHLETLMTYANIHAADYVYSWYEVEGGEDPLPHFGKSFDPCNPVQTTITTLVRTDLAKEVGFRFDAPVGRDTPDGGTSGEDWQFTLGCVALDAHIVHAPHKTWVWRHHQNNTSGRGDRWEYPPQPTARVKDYTISAADASEVRWIWENGQWRVDGGAWRTGYDDAR